MLNELSIIKSRLGIHVAGMKTFALILAAFLDFLPSHAAVFVVTTTADSGPGSLRQAILDSNITSTRNEIDFDIEPGGVQVISLSSGLPIITTPVQILGSTQPGYAGSPLIQLDGDVAGAATGLWIRTSNCLVQGLSITRF